MDVLIRITTAIGDFCFTVLSFLTPGAVLVVLSAVVGVLMLLIWRYTSNQAAIADVRRQISAHLLATRLFKDNLAVTFRAQRQILWQALRLLGHAVRPTVIMAVPFVLVMSQLGLHYEFRPAVVGRPVRVTATIKPGRSMDGAAGRIALPEGVTCDRNDPCRAEALRTVDWRVVPSRAGDFTLKLGAADDIVAMPLTTGASFSRISKMRGGGWFDRVLFSAEPSIPAASVFESVTIHYPARSTPILGYDVHWLITLLVFSIVFAFVFKPILKVHI